LPSSKRDAVAHGVVSSLPSLRTQVTKPLQKARSPRLQQLSNRWLMPRTAAKNPAMKAWMAAPRSRARRAGAQDLT